jgi:AraC-like DNA-binding protein
LVNVLHPPINTTASKASLNQRSPLVSIIGDAVARARVTAMLRGLDGNPCTCLTVEELRRRLRAGGVRSLVLEARDRNGMTTRPLVAEIVRDYPGVSILIYCDQSRTPPSEIVSLVRAGAHNYVMHGMDDERNALRLALSAAEQVSAADFVLDALRDDVPPLAKPLVELFLRGADGPIPVMEAAKQLGVHRKTLRNRMDSAGCPAPTELRAWCRLFLAARLLDEPSRSVESVADQLDFPSASALRNLLKRRTGLAPYALRQAGGLRYLLARFRDECASRRRHATPDIAPAASETTPGSSTAAVARVAESEPVRPRRHAAARPTPTRRPPA